MALQELASLEYLVILVLTWLVVVAVLWLVVGRRHDEVLARRRKSRRLE